MIPPLFFFGEGGVGGGTIPTSSKPSITDYQNIIYNDSIFILDSTNITYDCTFVTFSGSLIFFLTFHSSIVILGSTNITYNYTFVTFGGSLIFLLTFDNSIVTYHHIWLYFYHIWWFSFFFFYSHWMVANIIMGGTNITYDDIIVTFGSSLIFQSHWMVPISH